MAAAPFLGAAVPVMSNYVPVLDDRLFLSGLVVFGAGCALTAARAMAVAPRVGTRPQGAGALRFGLNAAAVSAAVALIAFAWSYLALPAELEGKAYYEVLFWGGGHVLQFTWTLAMFAAWLALAGASGARAPLSPRVAILLFAIGLASVFATPAIYLAYDIVSVEHYRLQTWLMRIGGGLAIAPFVLAMLYALLGAPRASLAERPLRAALAWSVLLFAAGGLIGVAIRGSDVTIPAHYHGSIVGVTLAFMGLAYHLLPRLGYARPDARLATLQAWLYGAGQLAHVAGLVWSGGYGVQRKVAGADQVLRGAEQVAAMGLMGIGGSPRSRGACFSSSWCCARYGHRLFHAPSRGPVLRRRLAARLDRAPARGALREPPGRLLRDHPAARARGVLARAALPGTGRLASSAPPASGCRSASARRWSRCRAAACRCPCGRARP
jgi:hypothetical protein